MKKVIVLFVLLLGLLSACVPATALGGSPSNPINADYGLSSERVLPGSTWYYVSQYNPEAFGYGLSERNNRLDASFSTSQMPRVGQKGSSTITNGFNVKNIDAPVGWEVRIQRVYLQREVTDVDQYTYSFNDSMHFVFAVSVPTGADQSIETIIVTVQHGTTSQKIPLMVRLQSDQPQAGPACDNCTQS
jgi:hypothetical protein